MKQPVSYLSNHLLVFLALAFSGGIIIASQISLTPAASNYLGNCLLVLCLAIFSLNLLGKRASALWLSILLFIGTGCYHTAKELQPPQESHHIYNIIDKKTEATVIGTITTMPGFDGTTSQTILRSEQIRFSDKPDFQRVTGNIQIRLPGPWPDNLAPGDTVLVRGDFKRPDGSRSPGVFDYPRYLALKNILITGFVRFPLFIQKVQSEQAPYDYFRYLPERVRGIIGQQIDASVSPAHSGVYRAVLIGDTSRVDNITLENFKNSGTFHILAISGMHMTIIGSMLFACLYALLSCSDTLLRRYPVRKLAILLSLPILIVYGLLAGLNIPVFRAVLMSGIMIIAICTDRQKAPSALLAFAAMVILLVSPLQLFTASFQLSFIATVAIIFLFPILKKLLFPGTPLATTPVKRVLNWVLAALLVSVVATLATAPLTIHFFNRFSPIGIFATLIVEPIISLWTLPAGFLAIPFIFFQPDISAFLLSIGEVGLAVALPCVRFFAEFPFASIWLPAIPLWLITVYYLGLLGLTIQKSNFSSTTYVTGGVVAVSLLMMLVPSCRWQQDRSESLRISVLDVGQGSASLLQYPSGFTVLIDGGASTAANDSSVGERVIAPYLWQRGIDSLDAVAITHPDADHYNGLEFIIRHFSPKKLWVRKGVRENSRYQRLLDQAEQQRVEVISPHAGELWENGSDHLLCVANLGAEPGNPNSSSSRRDANSGLILKACSTGWCALFPGDIGHAEEKLLVQGNYNVQSDFLLAPHHGSKTSNSFEFLTAVSPKVLLVSSGRNNTDHFPHHWLNSDCEKLAIRQFTTANHGTLEVIADRTSYLVKGYAKKQGFPLASWQPVTLLGKEQQASIRE